MSQNFVLLESCLCNRKGGNIVLGLDDVGVMRLNNNKGNSMYHGNIGNIGSNVVDDKNTCSSMNSKMRWKYGSSNNNKSSSSKLIQRMTDIVTKPRQSLGSWIVVEV